MKADLKLIYPYFKKNAFKIILGLACMFLVDGTQLIIPQIIKQAVDTLNQASLNQTTLLYQCGLIILLGLVMAILRYGWRNLLMISARNVELGIRDDLFEHVLHLDLAFHDRVKTGDIMAHATSDINHVRMAFGFGLIVLVDTVFLGGATLAIMLWTHPKLTAIAMIPMPVLVFVTRDLGKKMNLFHKTAQESFSLLTEMVRESFFGIRIIKVFNFETIVSEKVAAASTDYFKKNLKRAVVTALLRPMLGLFFNISMLIILFYGGFLVIEKTLTAGELVAFIQYLGILAWPVIAIGWMTNLFQRGMASLKRINTLLETTPIVKSADHAVKPDNMQGQICFNHVHFSYQKDSPVLTDISLTLNAKSTYGISGPPGSGKTSLAQLIPRLYNPDNGHIAINNHKIDTLDLDYLRKHISFMPQESFLFSGTIRDNIVMGKTISDHELEQMLWICCLDQTIEKMPRGLDTIVGERGITLSGGQKQRIALARTLIVKQPIIILDDPISQMDTQTASRVMSQVHQMQMDAIRIIISHRISALAACDKIYILNKGRIHHSGTHQELIKTDRFYSESFKVQQFEEQAHV
ncbi:MAG: ABC transporter ATP-binding protein [Pseudomonadota bacterium]